MNKQKILLFALMGFLMISMVSAYNGYEYYADPWDVFGGEWATFTIIFLIVWGIFFFAGRRTYETYEDPQNKLVLGMISAGLALLVSMFLTKNVFLYGFAGEGLINTLTIIFGILLILALFKVLFKWFGKFGLVVALVITTIIFTFTDFYLVLPDNIMDGPVGSFIYWIRGLSWVGIGVLVIFVIIVVIKFFQSFFGGGQKAAGGGSILTGRTSPKKASRLKLKAGSGYLNR